MHSDLQRVQPVLLDTSIMIPHGFWMNTPDLKTLVISAPKAGKTVIIAEPVLDELMNQFSKRLHDLNTNIEKMQGELGIKIDFNLNEHLARYRTYLKRIRKSLEIATYPEKIDAKLIFDRIHAGKKPFKNGGVGFKDYIIWLSYMQYLEYYHDEGLCGPAYFLSKNITDFFDVDRLHPDLTWSTFEIIPQKSLSDFVEREIVRHLQRVESVEDQIRDNLYPGIGLNEIDSILREGLAGHYMKEEGSGSNFRFIHQIHSSRDLDVRAVGLPKSEVRVDIDGAVKLTTSPRLDAPRVPSMLANQQTNSVVLPFRINYIVNLDKGTVDSRRVSLREPYQLLDDPLTLETYRVLFEA